MIEDITGSKPKAKKAEAPVTEEVKVTVKPETAAKKPAVAKKPAPAVKKPATAAKKPAATTKKAAPAKKTTKKTEE